MLNTILNLALMGLAAIGISAVIGTGIYLAIDMYRETKQ